jgi:amino acid permease
MVGSGVVALPWTFQESGFILGLIICVVGLVVSYRTCILMIRCAGNDKEYFDTLYKYWGKWAYYLGFISTLLIMIAAVTSYFINLSSMLYYILLAILEWSHALPLDFKPITYAKFDTFSQAYVTIFVLAMELVITAKKDLSIFIRLMTYGSAFIIALIVFIIGFGFYGIGTTHYEFLGAN